MVCGRAAPQALKDDHAKMTAQLNQLMNTQNAVLAQAQAAAAAANNLATLADQQAKALAAVTQAVTNQLSQIQQAVLSGAVTNTQARTPDPGPRTDTRGGCFPVPVGPVVFFRMRPCGTSHHCSAFHFPVF